MRPIRAARNACHCTRPVPGEFFGGCGGAHQGPQNALPELVPGSGLVLGYWSGAKRTYHHTAPVNPLYGLHESLVILAEEGLEAAWARHRDNHLRLRAGLEALGHAFRGERGRPSAAAELGVGA